MPCQTAVRSKKSNVRARLGDRVHAADRQHVDAGDHALHASPGRSLDLVGEAHDRDREGDVGLDRRDDVGRSTARRSRTGAARGCVTRPAPDRPPAPRTPSSDGDRGPRCGGALARRMGRSVRSSQQPMPTVFHSSLIARTGTASLCLDRVQPNTSVALSADVRWLFSDPATNHRPVTGRRARARRRCGAASRRGPSSATRLEDSGRHGLAGDRDPHRLEHLARLDPELLHHPAQRGLDRRRRRTARRSASAARAAASVSAPPSRPIVFVKRGGIIDRPVEQERDQRPEVRQRLDLLGRDLDGVAQAGAAGERLQPARSARRCRARADGGR